MNTLTLPADVTLLPQVLDFMTQGLEALSCPPNLQISILIGVEEIFVNIAHYAYPPEDGIATIEFSHDNATPPTITCTFRDNGIPYNPLERATPDISLSIEDRPIGGLGIFMVQLMADTIHYRHENGENILTFEKKLVEAEG